MKHSPQQGVALIMVLIIVAMVSIISIQLITERNLHARRTSNIIMADNAWHFALGAETLASIAIVKSLKNEETVNLSQAWATEGIVFPIDGGLITAELKDLRSCFNLNGLLATASAGEQTTAQNSKPLAGEKVFAELLKALELDDVQEVALAARLRDWLDSDQQPAGFEGREDYEYSGYNPPYRTGDSLLGSRTELSTISGFTNDVLAQLLPYVCFIPGVTELVLNVNTIPVDQPELLSSFYDKLDKNTAASILNARATKGFDKTDFNSQLPAGAKLRDGVDIAFSSPYFSLTAKVELGRARVNLQSLLFYQGNKTPVQNNQTQTREVIVLARLGIND